MEEEQESLTDFSAEDTKAGNYYNFFFKLFFLPKLKQRVLSLAGISNKGYHRC